MYAFCLNISEICMDSFARVVAESKANCILDLFIESYYYSCMK